jgi:neutral ceramidase
LGGEFFSETGLNLKKTNSAKPYFTITIANGYVGYVPPKHEIEKGGYETWRCRTSFLAEDAEEIISNELKALIN